MPGARQAGELGQAGAPLPPHASGLLPPRSHPCPSGVTEPGGAVCHAMLQTRKPRPRAARQPALSSTASGRLPGCCESCTPASGPLPGRGDGVPATPSASRLHTRQHHARGCPEKPLSPAAHTPPDRASWPSWGWGVSPASCPPLSWAVGPGCSCWKAPGTGWLFLERPPWHQAPSLLGFTSTAAHSPRRHPPRAGCRCQACGLSPRPRRRGAAAGGRWALLQEPPPAGPHLPGPRPQQHRASTPDEAGAEAQRGAGRCRLTVCRGEAYSSRRDQTHPPLGQAGPGLQVRGDAGTHPTTGHPLALQAGTQGWALPCLLWPLGGPRKPLPHRSFPV